MGGVQDKLSVLSTIHRIRVVLSGIRKMSTFTALPLDSRDMRILWPPRPRPSTNGGASTPWTSPNFEVPFTAQPKKLPPTGVYGRSWVIARLELFGVAGKVKASANLKKAATESGVEWNRVEGEIVGKVETQLNGWLKGETALTLNQETINRCSDKIAQGNWKEAGKSLLSARLKTEKELSSFFKVEGELDITWDEFGCFFGITGKGIFTIDLTSLLPGGGPLTSVIEVEVPVTLRLGLGPKAWEAIARRISGPALRSAVQSFGNRLIANAVTAELSALGVFTFAAAGAVAAGGLMYLNCYLISLAKAEGYRQGNFVNYATGYVRRIIYARAQSEHARRELKNEARSRSSSWNGWKDAERAIRSNSLQIVERTIIDHFGSTATYSIFSGYSNPSSLVGSSIDDSEIVDVGMTMGLYLADEIDEIVAYLSRAGAGQFIDNTNRTSRGG